MIRKPFNVKNSAAVATISLTPNVGEAFRVKNIHVTPTAAVTEFLTIQIDRVTVGYIHIGTTHMNQAPFQVSIETQKTIFDQLKDAGISLVYPVPEGSTLTVTAPNAWTRMEIEYEIWDAADVKPTEINGAQAKEYIFLQYGTYNVAITAAGTYTLNAVHNPVEFPNFPFGDPVPSKTEMSILGIGCLGHLMAGAAFATDWLQSTYLRLYREREVLFDEDRSGLYILGNTALSAANDTMYYDGTYSVLPYGGAAGLKPIRIFPTALEFSAGEELAVQMSFVLAAGVTTLAISGIYVCMPIRVKRP